MDFSFNKAKKPQLYKKYTLLFLILAVCMYGPYLISGHTLIWNTDAFNQHLPLMIKYRELLLQFLRHPFKGPAQWSWSIGVGSDLFSIFSYYAIGDVFSYLALLFTTKFMVAGYQIIVVLRLYCVGLAFIYFAQHFNFKDKIVLSGAAVYMVNAYLLYASIAQPMFTTTFMLFPIIIVQIERVLQGGSAWPLTGAFLWMLVNNYYLAFVLGLGSIFYLVLRWGITYRNKIDFWKTIKKLAFSTVTSILLASCMLVPELIGVIHSTRAGAEFANGLIVYPLYYYLLLPKQLINGDNWKLMFWAALGIASIGYLAIVHIFVHRKKYKFLSLTFIIGLIMLLIPAAGAIFNGGMSASNRWTLLLYLPLALCVMIFLQELVDHKINSSEIKTLGIATGVYLIVLIASYFLQNDKDQFLPVIFLLCSLILVYLISENKISHPTTWLYRLIVANVCLNAIFAALPYNGNFASKMLNQGEYQLIANNRYGKMDKYLPRSGKYRINTISNNQITGQKKVFNDLTSGLSNVSSYFSIQNMYLGNFSTELQNIQYDNNIPLHQLDDRSVLNNFFGVKYIFSQTNSTNSKKIPAGYNLLASTKQKNDYDNNTVVQTQMYSTIQNFPLMWFSNQKINPATFKRLTPSGKERALASGVVTNQGGMKDADLSGNTVNIKSTLYSNRGKQVSAKKLVYKDSDETYRLRLNLSAKERKRLKGCELHVEFSNIKYVPFSLNKQISYEMKHAQDTKSSQATSVNDTHNWFKYMRYHILQGTPDLSYKLVMTGSKATETIMQPSQDMTSFFKIVNNGTMNMGYYGNKLPKNLIFKPSKLGTYYLNYRVVAVPLKGKYNKEVSNIQKNGIKNLNLSQDKLTGKINNATKGILTSSIPYSEGWSAQVDGKNVKVLRTNQAFIGLKLSKGKHNIVLNYRTPGLRAGIIITTIGLIWTIAILMIEKRQDLLFAVTLLKNRCK